MHDTVTARANANSRLAAFCDGVFAIALTLLIIDVRLESPDRIATTQELWHALRELLPTIFAFILSFGIILIAWVNHHAALKLVRGSSASFIYANGLLLLAVVVLPFPTALLGDFLTTDHAAPAVVLYDAALAFQAFAWILVYSTSVTSRLTRDDQATAAMYGFRKNAYVACALYSLLACAAFWLPLAVAVATTATMTFWLALGVRTKHE